MSQMKKPKDPNWKKRVIAGLNPDGKKLTDLHQQHRSDWGETIQSAIPHHVEQKQELRDRTNKGEKLYNEGKWQQI
jgi:hypothetical protein